LNYADDYVYNGTIGAPLNSTATRQYLYPNTPDTNRSCQSTISPDVRGVADNGYNVVKLQYQYNMGSSAYLRFATYGSYSNWFIHDPVADPFTLTISCRTTRSATALLADQVTTSTC